MNSSYYKYCIVPQCKSTTIKTPNKLFIYVPNNEQTRKQWLELAKRNDAHCLSTKSRMYFCEDHFDLANDMDNYMEYHIKGTVAQVRMKPDCLPSKFECQEHRRRKRTRSSTEQPYIVKKQNTMPIAEALENKAGESGTPGSSFKKSSGVATTKSTMTSKFYKYCAVDYCKSSTVKTPHKLFVNVPQKEPMRRKWMMLAKRDAESYSSHSGVYFCEDHFDLPNDMENYMKYRVMGFVAQVRMRPGCVPTKFDWQTHQHLNHDHGYAKIVHDTYQCCQNPEAFHAVDTSENIQEGSIRLWNDRTKDRHTHPDVEKVTKIESRSDSELQESDKVTTMNYIDIKFESDVNLSQQESQEDSVHENIDAKVKTEFCELDHDANTHIKKEIEDEDNDNYINRNMTDDLYKNHLIIKEEIVVGPEIVQAESDTLLIKEENLKSMLVT